MGEQVGREDGTAAEFEGKVALVTGGSSGIGRGAALELARRGARVAVFSYDAERNEEVKGELEALGREALVITGDVRQEAELLDAVRRIDETWGRLDHVVISAGINGVFAPLDELTLEEWNNTLVTNLTSTFLTTKATQPLLRRDGGSIVVISSVNGTRVFNYPGAAAYSTSKAGQLAFVKMVAVELAQQRIRINVVCPGEVRTNLGEATHPRHLDRIRWPVDYPKGLSVLTDGVAAEPADIAELITFLLSDRASFITGTEIWADAALSLVLA
ncbi:SDR family oxidoreductase [Microlunatus speluncae]|uniref:SDR family oxidoreductase n=1 Tax=Microlunatus speluncae TaxID=2594267 RepID=UPI0012665767|nr:SDR family NAD(P)-dependent oxidoreductase [Microlunatus speluncae]